MFHRSFMSGRGLKRRRSFAKRTTGRKRARMAGGKLNKRTAAKLYRAIGRVKKQGSQIIWLRNRLVPTPIGDATYGAPWFYSPHNLNDSNPIFGTTAADLDSDTYYHRHTKLTVKFSASGEVDLTNFTLMFVRLTRFAIDRYSMGNGGLNNLTPDLHFTVNPGGGVPAAISQASTFMLNPKFFRVLYAKRFHTVQNVTTAAGTTGVTSGSLANIFTKQFFIRTKYKMHNPAGDAKTLEACNVPQNNWFIICVGTAATPMPAAGAPFVAVEEVSSWTTST